MAVLLARAGSLRGLAGEEGEQGTTRPLRLVLLGRPHRRGRALHHGAEHANTTKWGGEPTERDTPPVSLGGVDAPLNAELWLLRCGNDLWTHLFSL